MNGHGLTSDALRTEHMDSIARSDTFEPQGVSKQAALEYLNSTDEGAMYWWRVAEGFKPGTPSEDITKRALGQLMTGLELPRMETLGTDEALVKLVAEGSTPTSYTPFWMRKSQLNAAIAEGRNLSDYFGLPVGSEAPHYGVYEMRAEVSAQVFINTVAPTSELGGLVTKSGGAEQALVPNRQLFHEPVHVRTVDNLSAITAEVERGAGVGISTPSVAKGLGALGIAAMAYDTTTTATHTSELLDQGNTLGARSEVLHFGGRNLGALGGAALGAQVLGAAGVETGPFDLLIGGAGAIGGAIAGDRLANAYDSHRIYHQPDAQGHTWHYNPDQPQQGWARDVPPLPGTPHGQHFTASPALANQLDYQASGVAVQLALSHAPRPQDPYSLPTNAQDSPSIRESPWHRDAQTHGWSRRVATGVMEHGMVNAHVEQADARRAAELDTASEAVLNHNATQTPDAIATRYQSAYEQRDWHLFGLPPEAVTHALHAPANLQQGPDGDTYARDASGQWSTPGWFSNSTAQGNLKDQLDHAYRHALDNRAYAVPGLAQPAHTSPAESKHAEDPQRPVAAPAISRHSSNRDLFEALSAAAMHKDVEAMRSVSQTYLQSDQGQAWLTQGHQFNQQQAQQAALDAQAQMVQVQAQHSPVMQR